MDSESMIGDESKATMNDMRSKRASKRLEWMNSESSSKKDDKKEGIRRERSDESYDKNDDERGDETPRVYTTTENVKKSHDGSIEVLDGENKIKMNENVGILNSFDELRSSGLKRSLNKEYPGPTVIQKYCIPSIIEGKNLICRAPTGMGKTMCFLIPIIERYKNINMPQACIISPTRELCEQIRVEATKLVSGTRISVVSIYGKKQDLPSYSGVDIIVATPGRLIDLLHKDRICLGEIKVFVLDEADKLLDMGFEMPIREIHGFVPKDVQTCLFSATYSSKLNRMINYFLPGSKISIEIMSETLRNIKQEVIEVNNKKKKLLDILQNADLNLKGSWRNEKQPDKILVFVERKSECGEVEKVLKRNGISCVSLHGDKEQVDRNDALKGFRDGRYPVMVATSVAARGIDIKDVKIVINYDIPKDIKEYIHRIGRTGREGKAGRSISFYDTNVSQELKNALISVLKESKNEIPRFMSGSNEDFNSRFERLKIAADKEESEDEEVGLWG